MQSRATGIRQSSRSPWPLYDAHFEHDACGVGFVAQLSNQPSHAILTTALEALSRLRHRGAVAADERSGDGAGVLIQLPRDFFLEQLQRSGVTCSQSTPVAVAMLFADRGGFKRHFEQALAKNGLRVQLWRRVPVCGAALGTVARRSQPLIVQAIITDSSSLTAAQFEAALSAARTRFEKQAPEHVYVCSMSSRTLVYKALCNAGQLSEFYADLRDPGMTTACAVFHQRFATNTQPSWALAQPFRFLAHNGEINTVAGNRLWFEARQQELPAEKRMHVHPNSSDSALLDNALEAAIRDGGELSQALAALVPPAWENSAELSTELVEFYRRRAVTEEPWDGPAALAFVDGQFAGAMLDRNGLRPCRYLVTRDGLIVAGSEAGIVDVDPADITESGRLGPGEMLLVDLEGHHILNNAAVKENLAPQVLRPGLQIQRCRSVHKSSLLPDDNPLPDFVLQRLFGYTREDLQFVLSSMARDGKDAVWSMGDDTPLINLTTIPRSIYAFLRQRFAQVTNPAIDSLREQAMMSLRCWLGARTETATGQRRQIVELQSPVLKAEELSWIKENSGLRVHTLSCTFDPAMQSLQQAIESLLSESEVAIKDGYDILLLSDKYVGGASSPIPMALALGALHHHLLGAGLRIHTDLVAEAGDCYDVHHCAVLIGLGARSIVPWMALRLAHEAAGLQGEENLVSTLNSGLLKVMAKMGISTAAGYCGGQTFEVLGLGREITGLCFPELPNALSGIGWAKLEEILRQRHESAFGQARVGDLPDWGLLRFRREGERHAWSPATVRALQTAVGSTRSAAPLTSGDHVWKSFDELANNKAPLALRDLLGFTAKTSVPLEEVEPACDIVRRFVTSAMSLGSLSPEAHQTLAVAMNRLGARSNTGEGGEDPRSYASTGDVERWDNKIKQIASGRFGVTAEYIARAEELEIKIAQGSKPGEGGQIPASKVTHLIARLRHAQPGIALISPPPHHDIYSIEDLAQLIYDLRRCNPNARIGVKLVAESGVGTVAAGVAKARADFLVIAGHCGGTGASPLSSIKHAGMPWELGLAETQQVLLKNHLRSLVRLRVDGGLRSARDVVLAALLGADEFAFGTGALVALGCDMARQCHLNTCPTGIATQRPELRAKFRGRPENVIAYFLHVAEQARELLATLGLRCLQDAVGRTDLLRQERFEGDFDLAPLLARPRHSARRRTAMEPVRSAPPALDDALVEPAVQAVSSGSSFHYSAPITNRDLCVGARIAGEIARKSRVPTNSGTVTLVFRGSAGQSFAAFCCAGMRMVLIGEANDYVAKGLCGAEVILRPAPELRVESSKQHIILGNVALYGATSGLLFAAGAAGERFAVRNSGATAVVEGVGHHGCEYMTGGAVLVLGGVGPNFGAGMTGGSAYVLDAESKLEKFINHDSVCALPLSENERTLIRELLERHYEATGSARALELLMRFDDHAEQFRAIRPRHSTELVLTPEVAAAAMSANSAPQLASSAGD